MKIEDCFKKQLLIKKKQSLEKAQKSLDTAEVYIQKAKDNFKIKNYDITIVVAYTSMFHSLRSILFKDGIKERSHICLLSYIKDTYPELSGIVNSVDIYRRFRHTALYGLETPEFQDEAETSIEIAREVYNTVEKKFLKI